MICFKDMTFCSFFEECMDGEDCHRALTEGVWREAEESGMPISRFAEWPECFVKGDNGGQAYD